MSADRRYKLIGQGLVGRRSFDLADLLNTHIPTWNSTTETWDLILSSGLAGSLDHGTPIGLADDDHTQYLLASRKKASITINAGRSVF